MSTRIAYFLTIFGLFGLNMTGIKAQDSLLQALSKHQDNIELYLKLGKFYYPDSLQLSANYLNKGIQKALLKKDFAQINQLYFMKARIAKRQGKIQETFDFLDKTTKYAHQNQDTTNLINIYRLKGNVYREQSKYLLAQQYNSEAYTFAKNIKDTLLEIKIQIDQAYIYNYWSKNDTALQILNDADAKAKKIQYQKGLARITTLIGNIYFGLEKYPQSLRYYRRSYLLAKKLNSIRGQGVSLINIGISLSALHQYKNAIDTMQIAIQIIKGSNISSLIANTYGNLATVYADSGLFRKAFESMDSCAKYYKKVGTPEALAILFFLRSDIYYKFNDFQNSISSLDSCMNYVEKINFYQMREKAFLSYIKSYKSKGDYHQAFRYYEKYSSVKDSSLNQQMQRQLMDYEAKYKILEKEKEIESLANAKSIAELSRDKRRNERNILIIVILLVITVFIAFVQKKKKEKALQAIQKEKELLQKSEMEQKLNFQSKQLTTHALNMLQNNELLLTLQKDIADLQDAEFASPKLNHLQSQIKNHLNKKSEWDLFKMYFEEVHQDFFKKIRTYAPNLTANDERIIALIKLNLNVKEIAAIQNISPDSVKNARHRLRKKFNLSRDMRLHEFINQVDATL